MMFLAGAAASTALDLVSSLSKTLDEATKSSKSKHSPFQISNSDGTSSSASSTGACASGQCGTIAPGTMNALFQAQGAGDGSQSSSSTGKLGGYGARMMSFLDADKDGAVSASELSDALGDKATDEQKNALLAKLDGDGNGSISQDELASALRNYRGQQHRHHHMNAAAIDPAASAATTTNAASGTGSTSLSA